MLFCRDTSAFGTAPPPLDSKKELVRIGDERLAGGRLTRSATEAGSTTLAEDPSCSSNRTSQPGSGVRNVIRNRPSASSSVSSAG